MEGKMIRCVTWADGAGKTIVVPIEVERQLRALDKWPRGRNGEYCTVSRGEHERPAHHGEILTLERALRMCN